MVHLKKSDGTPRSLRNSKKIESISKVKSKQKKKKILEGGLPAWESNQFETTDKPTVVTGKSNYKSKRDDSYIVQMKEMIENFNTKERLVIDARYLYKFFFL